MDLVVETIEGFFFSVIGLGGGFFFSVLINYAPPLTFDRVELRGSLIAQKFAKSRNPTGKLFRNSNLLFKKSYSQKTLFFDLPPPTVGTLARHTHAEIC